MYYITVQKKYTNYPSQEHESAGVIPALCADWFLFSFNDKLKSSTRDDVLRRVKYGSGIVIYCKDEHELRCMDSKLRLADTSKSFIIRHSLKDAYNEVSL